MIFQKFLGSVAIIVHCTPLFLKSSATIVSSLCLGYKVTHLTGHALSQLNAIIVFCVVEVCHKRALKHVHYNAHASLLPENGDDVL